MKDEEYSPLKAGYLFEKVDTVKKNIDSDFRGRGLATQAVILQAMASSTNANKGTISHFVAWARYALLFRKHYAVQYDGDICS